MSDPNEKGAGVTATLKLPPSKQYANDGAWLVFHGSVARVREDIIEALGLEVDAGTPLADVVVSGGIQFTATDAAIRGAGGKTLGGNTGSGPRSPAKEEPQAEAAPVTLADEIEALVSLEDHKIMWADRKAELQGDTALLEAWKTKGRALKDAA